MKSLELTIETSKLCTCSTGGAGSPATSRQADLTMAPTAQSYGALMTAMHKSGKWQKGVGDASVARTISHGMATERSPNWGELI